MEGIVPHVLHVEPGHHPWKVASIERLAVQGHTAQGVRVRVGTLAGVTGRAGQQVVNRPDRCVVCVPSEQAWADVQAAHAAHQSALDQIVQVLRNLGRYCDQLSTYGDAAPNPLAPTIVHLYQPPDRSYNTHYMWDGKVPELFRYPVLRHTAKMVFFDSSPCAQTHCYPCPDDGTWEQLQVRHSAARDAHAQWNQLLERLGTYGEARADGRYTTSLQ